MIGHDDLSKIWAGPRALLVGADPYDPATWQATAVALGTFPPDTAVYLYPPWVAVLLLPLALLPLTAASVLWTAGGIAAASAVLRSLLRRALPGRPFAHATAAVTLLLSGPAISALLTGQWSYVLVAAVGLLVLLLRTGRPAGAGVASLAMLTKPQLFLYAAPALALGALWPGPSPRDRAAGVRFVRTALGATAVAVAVSHVLVPSWWPAWIQRVGASQFVPESVTIPGLLFRTFGERGLLLAPVALLGLVVIALRFHPRSAAWPAVWLSLTIAATPYSNPYDLLLLLVPLVLAAGALADDRPRRAAVVFYAGSAILLLFATALHALALLAYAPLVPAATFGLIVVACWDHRRGEALVRPLPDRGTVAV